MKEQEEEMNGIVLPGNDSCLNILSFFHSEERMYIKEILLSVIP
jgi:hypothetical protein